METNFIKPRSFSILQNPLAKPIIPRDKYDISISIKVIVEDYKKLYTSLIENGQDELVKYRTEIVSVSRGNFILERELHDIDDKIKLLILNRISVQDVISSSGLQRDPPTTRSGFTPDMKHLYEQLFYILQMTPIYLANISRIVSPQEIPLFVQTVVFDLFGDQYDSREERLLLSLFRSVLACEFDNAVDMGSFLRANTAITQMLSAYARRGHGLTILQETLSPPLNEITSHKDLNLEINPLKVYQCFIATYESETGKKTDLPHCETNEQVLKIELIANMIDKRVADLTYYVEAFLSRIVNGVDSVPYGMRWICKQLASMAKNKFPSADRFMVGSLIGGYVYLRFFNPVIVTPDALNFIKEKPTKIMRRNLILIAKILQNLSNGILFGDKEEYMMRCNSFIEQNRERLASYFEKLIMVDDLEDALAVDQYLEHVQTRNSHVNISYNQVSLIHSLLDKNIDIAAPNANDCIRRVLKELGPVPTEVKIQDNFTFGLTLSEPRNYSSVEKNQDRKISIQKSINKSQYHPLYTQAKKLLLNLFQTLESTTFPDASPVSLRTTSLSEYLADAQTWATQSGNERLVDQVTNMLSMLNTLYSMGLLPQRPIEQESFTAFVLEIEDECNRRPGTLEALQRRTALVRQALSTISLHQQYLQTRLDLYKQYLDNVRKGESQSVQLPDKAKRKEKKVDPIKFTHKELEEMGIVCSVDPAIKKGVLKDCNYLFSEVESGKFKVEVIYSKGINFNVLKEPLILMLENLLKMAQNGEHSLELDYVSLDVNLLIHLLNTRFIAAESKRLFS